MPSILPPYGNFHPDPDRRRRESAHFHHKTINYVSPVMKLEEDPSPNRAYRKIKQSKKRQQRAKLMNGKKATHHRVVDPKYTDGWNYVIHLTDGMVQLVDGRRALIAMGETIKQAVSYEHKISTRRSGKLLIPYRISFMEESDFIIAMMLIDRSKIIKIFRTTER